MKETSIATGGDSLFTVTDLCREFDVTPRALRFYEAKGLLSPERVGTRRRYRPRDRTRLSLILQGKRFGFSLNEIGELLDLYQVDPTQVTQLKRTLEVAHRRLEEMIAQRDELAVAITDLQAQIETVESELSEKLDSDAAVQAKREKPHRGDRGEQHGDLSAART